MQNANEIFFLADVDSEKKTNDGRVCFVWNLLLISLRELSQFVSRFFSQFFSHGFSQSSSMCFSLRFFRLIHSLPKLLLTMTAPMSSRLNWSHVVGVLLFFGSAVSHARPLSAPNFQTDAIYSGASLQEKSLSQLVSEVLPGTVVVISEQHTLLAHHDKQVLLLEELKRQNRRVSVGLEFLSYSFQDETNQYLAGQLSDTDFQKQVGWGSIDFNMYKKQILFSLGSQGYTLAINAPRSLTNRISKVGLSQLTQKERDLLPPNFQLGNSLYRERFVEVMQNHIPAEALDRYFEAQSTWDDTMAWVASDFIQSHPDQVLVILVGDFHAQYGGGLPDRLRARGVSRLKVISQVQLGMGTPADDEAEMVPHSRYGVRADEIWVSR